MIGHSRFSTMELRVWILFLILVNSAVYINSSSCAGSRRNCKCDDVENVSCVRAFLTHLPSFDEAIERNIVTLDLKDNVISFVRDIDLKGYTVLKSLDVRYQIGRSCVEVNITRMDITILGACNYVSIFV